MLLNVAVEILMCSMVVNALLNLIIIYVACLLDVLCCFQNRVICLAVKKLTFIFLAIVFYVHSFLFDIFISFGQYL